MADFDPKAWGPAREAGLWDRLVNEKWGGAQPILSGPASVKAAKRLYRRAMGRPWTGPTKITSGNRRTWVRAGVLVVNPDERQVSGRGLREIIHSIAHYAHRRKHPDDAPHSARQAYIERDLVDYAIKHGWADPEALEPAPKPTPVKPDKVQQKYQAMVRRRDKWAAEADRAKRLHAKAAKEVRDYERRHGARVRGEG